MSDTLMYYRNCQYNGDSNQLNCHWRHHFKVTIPSTSTIQDIIWYLGLRSFIDFGAYRDPGAPEFGFSTLFPVMSFPEIVVGTTCGFHYSSMLSANIGVRGCDGMRR
jgi:hypothetical protein